jgi:dinuclear metal center YbgI/SA1388 family protein
VTLLAECVDFLDATLNTNAVPDYDRALNGLQLANQGRVTRIAAAVDFSLEALQAAATQQADLLLVHHGMFWSGLVRFAGASYEKLRIAFAHDIAVYSSHLPLDLHPQFGNNALLARELDLVPDTGFGRFRDVAIGVSGPSDCETAQLAERVRALVEPLGSRMVSTPIDAGRRTSRWAIVSGAGASSDTLREAQERGVDTLIVGEGPHHTAIEAQERGIVVLYAGHYATETLGVQAIAAELGRRFSVPWSFLRLPTGL